MPWISLASVLALVSLTAIGELHAQVTPRSTAGDWSDVEEEWRSLRREMKTRDDRSLQLPALTARAEQAYRACDPYNGRIEPKALVRRAEESRLGTARALFGLTGEINRLEAVRQNIEAANRELQRKGFRKSVYLRELRLLMDRYELEYFQPMRQSVLPQYDNYLKLSETYVDIAEQAAGMCKDLAASVTSGQQPEPQIVASSITLRATLTAYQQSALSFVAAVQRFLAPRRNPTRS